jgi:hypothetical protein
MTKGPAKILGPLGPDPIRTTGPEYSFRETAVTGIPQPPKALASGDRVFCWESGAGRRMVGLAEFVSPNTGTDPNGEIRFHVRYLTRKFADMPTIGELRQVRALEDNMSVSAVNTRCAPEGNSGANESRRGTGTGDGASRTRGFGAAPGPVNRRNCLFHNGHMNSWRVGADNAAARITEPEYRC